MKSLMLVFRAVLSAMIGVGKKKNLAQDFDATEKTGHPFHIYKITNRVQTAPGTLRYVLHFGSREFMRNIRTKVSQAYDGRLDRAVYAMFLDENYLDSKKTLTFEPCGNSDKIVIPNMRPFDATI